MKTEFTITLSEKEAREFELACAERPGVHPEMLLWAWVADQLDAERIKREQTITVRTCESVSELTAFLKGEL